MITDRTPNEEVISKVKSNSGSYESTSLANDDVDRLLVVIRDMQKQSDLLTLGLLQAKNRITKLEDNINLILTENFSGQSTLSPYAKRQAEQALKPGE